MRGEAHKIAKNYAQALFDLAHEEGKLTQVKKDLEKFHGVLKLSHELKQVLESRMISFEEVSEVLKDILAKTKPQSTTLNFLLNLVQQKRFVFFNEILNSFLKIKDEQEGVVRPHVTSAVELSEAFKKEVKKSLEDVTHKKVEPQFFVDSKILGGLVTKLGSKVFDGSLKTKLESLLVEN